MKCIERERIESTIIIKKERDEWYHDFGANQQAMVNKGGKAQSLNDNRTCRSSIDAMSSFFLT